ncbi:hypothetical protein CL653_00755 [bacterium]|nr:hypothetical protein [bacterium]
MKKSLLVTIGISVFILIALVWLYLFLFGAPESSSDLFADLGFETSDQPITPVIVEEGEDFSTIGAVNSPLRQLTVRPVAGFVATSIASSTKIRYAEQGTGHIYELDLETGQESRISGTTIPRVNEAVFSDRGEEVVLKSANGYSREVLAGRINNPGSDGSVQGFNLPPESQNWQFTDTGLAYTLQSNSGTDGYLYNLSTNSQQTLFTVPFLSIEVIFARDGNFVFNRHSPKLPGGLYKAEGFNLTPITTHHFGLSALHNQNWSIISYTTDRNMFSFAILNDDGREYSLALNVIPEKCTFSSQNPNQIWCGAPIGDLSHQFQEDWYKGLLHSNDVFWLVDILAGSADLVANPSLLVGREIDVMNLQEFGNNLIFINKNDNTLWIYDFTNL